MSNDSLTYPHRTSDMSNDELTRRFIDHLRIEKGTSANTVEAYLSDLRQFSAFLTKPLLEASRQDIGQYQESLLAKGIEGRSVHRKICALRAFYKLLHLDRVVPLNPAAFVKSPKSWKVLPKALTPVEVDAVMNEKGHSQPYVEARDQAMFEVLYGSGLRASEMITAMLRDVNLTEGFLLVHGKGDKERIAPLGGRAVEALKTYLASRHMLLNRIRKPAPFQQTGYWCLRYPLRDSHVSVRLGRVEDISEMRRKATPLNNWRVCR